MNEKDCSTGKGIVEDIVWGEKGKQTQGGSIDRASQVGLLHIETG